MNNQLFKQAQQFVVENSAALLTGTGVVGVVTTAVLTGRASFRAAKVIQEKTPPPQRLIDEVTDGPQEVMDTMDKVKLVWPLFIPPVASGITTITAVVFSYRISASKSAALAAAYGISEKAFQDYKDKVIEKVGLKKETDVRDDLAKDQLDKNPVDGQTVFISGGGDVLCFDTYSGRYFRSSVEAIKKAENKINYEILKDLGASMSSFYDELGLPATQYSDEMGWNTTTPLDVSISAQLVEQKPCLVIDFRQTPVINYDRNY